MKLATASFSASGLWWCTRWAELSISTRSASRQELLGPIGQPQEERGAVRTGDEERRDGDAANLIVGERWEPRAEKEGLERAAVGDRLLPAILRQSVQVLAPEYAACEGAHRRRVLVAAKRALWRSQRGGAELDDRRRSTRGRVTINRSSSSGRGSGLVNSVSTGGSSSTSERTTSGWWIAANRQTNPPHEFATRCAGVASIVRRKATRSSTCGSIWLSAPGSMSSFGRAYRRL